MIRDVYRALADGNQCKTTTPFELDKSGTIATMVLERAETLDQFEMPPETHPLIFNAHDITPSPSGELIIFGEATNITAPHKLRIVMREGLTYVSMQQELPTVAEDTVAILKQVALRSEDPEHAAITYHEEPASSDRDSNATVTVNLSRWRRLFIDELVDSRKGKYAISYRTPINDERGIYRLITLVDIANRPHVLETAVGVDVQAVTNLEYFNEILAALEEAKTIATAFHSVK